MSSCRENICHIVKAPANVSWKIRKLATEVAYKAVSSLEGAGVFAVELFMTEDGQVEIQLLSRILHGYSLFIKVSCGLFFRLNFNNLLTSLICSSHDFLSDLTK